MRKNVKHLLLFIYRAYETCHRFYSFVCMLFPASAIRSVLQRRYNSYFYVKRRLIGVNVCQNGGIQILH